MSKSLSRNLWAATSLLLILAMLLGFAGSLAVQAADGDEPELRGAQPLPKAENQVGSSDADPVVQDFPGVINMPGTIENWEGIPATGVYPPDTDGQVGPNHYVQIVNAASTGSRVRVWDKSGNQLSDFGLTNLWPSGDRCQLYGYGDPVVLYDQIADRWLLTQFTYPPSGPYNECIAVSKTGVPTGNPSDWYLYTFNVHASKFNDYPKIGVWPDGYYMMAHQFTSTWAGTGVWVFNRTKMINGTMAQAPTPITCSNTSTDCYYKDLYSVNSNYGGMLPVNLMGNTLPPTGSPNYFVEVDANWYGSTDVMTIFGFKVDWNNPANSQFGRVGELVVSDFDSDICSAYREQCIDQPGTSVRLEAIADRLMMHAWYRNMGTYETIVLNHTVDASGRAGIRWYEIQKDDPSIPNINPSPPAPDWGPWELHQQGTYAPDNNHRWMGSIAMDAVGNIALGYSISSSSVYPGIRYAGRLATDPLGTLPQAEGTIINGSGSQTGSGARWGDYSALSVDPVDDCTFWYTTEYMQTTSATGWQTRVASFKFPNCEAVNPGTLQGKVTNSSTSSPIQGVKVQISGTEGYQANTNATGNYAINVNPDTYTVTFSKFGYSPVTVNGVVVESDETTTQNAQLAPLPTEAVAGVV
ncbi:MAG: carboxypeptidase regulatory-like domain-containing protein, partial [Anaerolineales bacterium]|nr:carboxypeptidase regulatory-like domain-containing protein [Anaerolineales bacterium]